MKIARGLAAATLLLFASVPGEVSPQQNKEAAEQAPGSILLTIFFKHDQSKPLADINAQLKQNGFYDKFPPHGIEVVSWYVMMGIGQVVTLRVPADRLREVVEESAWGGYRTEFYPTYDYRVLAEQQRSRMRQQ